MSQFKIYAEGWKGSFLAVDQKTSRIGSVMRRVGKTVYMIEIQKSPSFQTYMRDVYGVWNIVGDLGGVLSFIITIF